jgi:hypothetical protein
MVTNTLEMVGFSTEKYWFFSFQESRSYTNSTENTEKVLSVKTMDFDGVSVAQMPLHIRDFSN